MNANLDGLVLGIETSCDETAAAVLDLEGRVRSGIVSSQHATHGPYGGVVPELAARRHIETIEPIVRRALDEATAGWTDLRLIACTSGPGLAGALLVGLSYGKALAYALRIPWVTVNHLEGHVASAWIDRPAVEPSALVLVVSGGHTHLYRTTGDSGYRLLGRTLDDAAGEAFDKGAKLLGLGFPGGPAVDKLAQSGNPTAIQFPRSLGKRTSLDFSFSGLKTALLYYLRDHPDWEQPNRSADIAASYQEAIVDVLVTKALRAVAQSGERVLAVVGGVSANSRLRARLMEAGAIDGIEIVIPPLSLCTDNAVMIARAGLDAYRRGRIACWDMESVANASFPGLDHPLGQTEPDRSRRLPSTHA
ncbi:MAG: tRNA (adenosine(37)-N6)-threonylcarbamoyltransferase complex transferase subunit TsaD [Nitrospiraceae bacterium]